MSSQIKEFFQNQTVFITGGSGFLGKLFIEKLLRECDIQKIYVLMRPKKNKSPEERFSELFNYPCFDVVKAENPDSLRKVSLINGDCQQADLGLNESDIKILEETTCVIHAAANVKFDQTLKEASYNVRATKDVLELAKRMKNLKSFVYISTFFSNCVSCCIKEDFYEPPMEVEDLITLIKTWPNTYVYTKCISEDCVRKASEEVPVVVIRPAIITGTVAEPVTGWIDNFYGAVGVSCGAALGVIRTIYAKKAATAPLIPADYVINCTLAAAWYRQQSGTTKIYNFVGHKENRITWGSYDQILKKIRHKVIPVKAVWHDSFQLRENRTWNKICVFFLHTSVGYFVDFVLFCLRKPTIAVKAYERLNKQLELLSYFTTRTWNFECGNVTELWRRMENEDRRLFAFDLRNLDWEGYLYGFVKGARVYLIKDGMETLPRAQRKVKVLLVAHYMVKILLWWLIYKSVVLVLRFFF